MDYIFYDIRFLSICLLFFYFICKINKICKKLKELEDKKLDKEVYKYYREIDDKFKDFVPFSVRNGYSKKK